MCKIKVNLRPFAFDAYINDYFDSNSSYCLISLSNFTNNKGTSRSANIPQTSNSRYVTGETRASFHLFEFENENVDNVDKRSDCTFCAV